MHEQRITTANKVRASKDHALYHAQARQQNRNAGIVHACQKQSRIMQHHVTRRTHDLTHKHQVHAAAPIAEGRSHHFPASNAKAKAPRHTAHFAGRTRHVNGLARCKTVPNPTPRATRTHHNTTHAASIGQGGGTEQKEAHLGFLVGDSVPAFTQISSNWFTDFVKLDYTHTHTHTHTHWITFRNKAVFARNDCAVLSRCAAVQREHAHTHRDRPR